MNTRIRAIISKFDQYKIDAYLVMNQTDIRYLTHFCASDSCLLITPQKTYYITDARYTLEAKAGLKGITVREHKKGLLASVLDLVRVQKYSFIGFDERHVTVHQFRMFQKNSTKSFKWVPANACVESLRIIKDEGEIQNIEDSLRLHHKAHQYLKKIIKPGMSERDVFLKLERFVKTRKAIFSFDPIIAGGEHSCLPHAMVTDRKICKNEPLLVDMGIDINGYKSDLTRMFFLGKMPARVMEVNDLVKDAQIKAIHSIKPGVKAKDVDGVARRYLAKHKLAKYFGHSLGHGVGLDIHEAPSLSKASETVLKEGMIITVEPGVYLSHEFGIRIEDMILVTKEGHRILSDYIN